MQKRFRHKGFTLVEVMLAAGILMIGLILVAGAFPLGIHMTTASTEKVVGSVVIDEAFAKIKLNCSPIDTSVPPKDRVWGIKTEKLSTESFESLENSSLLYQGRMSEDDLSWPSVDTDDGKHYYWSALLKRHHGGSLTSAVAVVFVNRITGASAQYPDPDDPVGSRIVLPKPIRVPIVTSGLTADTMIKVLSVADDSATTDDEKELLEYIPDDAVLVMIDGDTVNGGYGPLVLHVIDVDIINNIITLKEEISSDSINSYFWVVPTAEDSTRNPLINVYQERFTF